MKRVWMLAGLVLCCVFANSEAQAQTTYLVSLNSGAIASISGQMTITDAAHHLTAARANPYESTNGNNLGALLQWQTAVEVASLGFHIYREDQGKLQRISKDFIAGSALFAGTDTQLRAGRTYAFRDPQPLSDTTRYYVEEVTLDGRTQLYGPVYPDSSNPIKQDSIDDREASKWLGDLNAADNAESETLPVTPVETLAAMPKSNPRRLTAQAALASQSRARLSVKQTGWYRLTQAELAAAGFITNRDPRFLQLFVDGTEIPIKVNGEADGKFDATDSIEFYGQALDSNFTNTRAYFLLAGSAPGRRIIAAPDSAGRLAPANFTYGVERKDRTIYFSSLRNGEKENFFGAVISRTPLNQTINVDKLADTPLELATLVVAVQGVTSVAHQLQVNLNGVEVGRINFDWQEEGEGKFTVAHSLLRDGQNTVTLIPLGGNSDIALVDRIRLFYQRRYSVVNDSLMFTANGNDRLTLDGFTGREIQVFDVTDKNFPQEVSGQITAQNSTYSITLNVPGNGQRLLLAATATRFQKPVVTMSEPTNWRNANQGADYLIITRKEFFDVVKPLAALREAKGLKVAVVDIEDLYDEFSFGQKTPQAVRDFLNFAKSNWRIAPRYVLLAADATYDPKDYLQRGNLDLVPTRLVDTEFIEAATDDWFSDFNHDGIADIATGRLPARSAQELTRFINKILNYEKGTKTDSALLVADVNAGYDFEGEVDQLRPLIPGNLTIDEVKRGQLGDALARSRLLELLNRGPKIVTYAGHGSVNLWSGGLFNATDALNLTNGSRLPVFVMTSCLNGYFQDPSLDSLGEALLKAENGGAIAVWASSALTFPQEQAVMNQQFYWLVLNRTPSARNSEALTIGEAAIRAKAAIQDNDIRRSWILLGDPALRLK